MVETLLVLGGALVTQSVIPTGLTATTGDVLIGYVGINPPNGTSQIDGGGKPYTGEWVDLPHQEPANAWRFSVAPGFQQCNVLMRMGGTSEKDILFTVGLFVPSWGGLSAYVGSSGSNLLSFDVTPPEIGGLVIEYTAGNLTVKDDFGVMLLAVPDDQIEMSYAGTLVPFDYTALYPFAVTGTFQSIYDATGGHDAIRYFYYTGTPVPSGEFWGNFILSKEVA